METKQLLDKMQNFDGNNKVWTREREWIEWKENKKNATWWKFLNSHIIMHDSFKTFIITNIFKSQMLKCDVI